MSWEGYEIAVCENGCISNIDPRCCDCIVCPECGSKIVSSVIINETNDDEVEKKENAEKKDEIKKNREKILTNSAIARNFQINKILERRTKYLNSVSMENILKNLRKYDDEISEINRYVNVSVTGRSIIPNKARVDVDDPSETSAHNFGTVWSSTINENGRIVYKILFDKNHEFVDVDEDFVSELSNVKTVCSSIFKRVERFKQYRWFTIGRDGSGYFWKAEPFLNSYGEWGSSGASCHGQSWRRARGKFDTTNYKNSKIERG